MYSHFFGGKKAEEKQPEHEEQKTESKNQEEKPKAETDKAKAEAEKPKAEAPKATKVPETFDALIDSLPAEHKKRVQALYKKLEEDNAKHAKAIKELNEKVKSLWLNNF